VVVVVILQFHHSTGGHAVKVKAITSSQALLSVLYTSSLHFMSASNCQISLTSQFDSPLYVLLTLIQCHDSNFGKFLPRSKESNSMMQSPSLDTDSSSAARNSSSFTDTEGLLRFVQTTQA
jgi:hypothetical protein